MKLRGLGVEGLGFRVGGRASLHAVDFMRNESSDDPYEAGAAGGSATKP